MQRELFYAQRIGSKRSTRTVLPNGVFTDLSGHGAAEFRGRTNSGVRQLRERRASSVNVSDVDTLAGNPARHSVFIQFDEIASVGIGDDFTCDINGCGRSESGAGYPDNQTQSQKLHVASLLRAHNPIDPTFGSDWQRTSFLCFNDHQTHRRPGAEELASLLCEAHAQRMRLLELALAGLIFFWLGFMIAARCL